ncbi:hypothetical protein Fmac_030102 [Flemingia macrophylla]|uniref:CCHC-type domain-containing protein n=1 Tax=Flemingia macrophylla TaxID=520843 RepID=A0ABD1LC69_9FABA
MKLVKSNNKVAYCECNKFGHLKTKCSNIVKKLQSFHVEDIKQDYDTGKDGITMVTFEVDFDQAEKLEDALKSYCSRELKFYKR